MDKICIVFDIDETLLHYMPELGTIKTTYDLEQYILEEGDVVIFRPGLKEFIEYVKSKNGKILLGIWTYGTKWYAGKIVEKIEQKYNGGEKLFKFVYSREDMKPGMLDKELDFVIANNQLIGLTKDNTFLIDNRPDNIYHAKNINNGIMVESFFGTEKNISVDMFKELTSVCESLLSDSRIPDTHKKDFKVHKEIYCFGENFDDGLTPLTTKTLGGKYDRKNYRKYDRKKSRKHDQKHYKKHDQKHDQKNDQKIFKRTVKRKLRMIATRRMAEYI
jgi:hypothetical protein